MRAVIRHRPQEARLTAMNLLLQRLPPADAAFAMSHCTRIILQRGEIVGVDGSAPTCFPEDAVLSVADRTGIEVAMIGAEGMLGWTVAMSGFQHPLPAVVEIAGTALAISAEALADLCHRSAPLRHAVLQFGVAASAQMASTIIATARHQLDRRIARRLLMLHDRCAGDSFPVTHAQISRSLGIRRAGVTDWLHVFEGERILRCTRNCVEVLDRAKLRLAAGAAYGQAERAYRGVLGPFGK